MYLVTLKGLLSCHARYNLIASLIPSWPTTAGQYAEINVNSLSKFSLCRATANSDELCSGCQVKVAGVVFTRAECQGRSERSGAGLASGSNLLAGQAKHWGPPTHPPAIPRLRQDSCRNQSQLCLTGHGVVCKGMIC